MPLYDTYRARYPELVGHLENARKRNRLSHAFLLHADNETLRREFSIVLAQLAACPESRDGRPCTVCRVCRSLEEGTYPELYFLAPVGKMYQIKIGDRGKPEPNTLRFFEEQFHLTSTGGGNCKVGIICDADRMNDESQNALLKTLEEPPPQTLLILTTGNPSALLPTTRSRCQLVPLLTNRCEFDFAGKEAVCAALAKLCFESRGDLAAAEAGAAELIRLSAGLSSDASARIAEAWKSRLAAAEQTGDPGLVKRTRALVDDAAAGACMKERGLFLETIRTFCSQLELLANGVSVTDLANPELFENLPLPELEPERAELFRREAEELLFTLRFNVNEELALRTFAVNLAMKS